MGGKQFKKAAKLYKLKKYAEVIQLLQPQVFRFRDSFQFYYLIGMSCLHTGDYAGAYTYLRRGIDLNPESINTFLGLAVVHLKRQETAEAIQCWFSVLDIDPRNKYAKRGLQLLKKKSDNTETLEYFFESVSLYKLVPRPSSSSVILLKTFFVLSSIIIIAVLIFSIHYFISSQQLDPRPEIAKIHIDDQKLLIDPADNSHEDYHYIFSENEIKKLFNNIQNAFHQYNDNLARREINRLLLSNASKEVKEKANLLSNYIRKPNFSTLSKNFSFQEVQAKPVLYDNCYVKWGGRVSNLVIGDDKIQFDLLVGYEDGRILEGIVPVTLYYAARIDPSMPINVLGKIIINNARIELTAVSIHQKP